MGSKFNVNLFCFVCIFFGGIISCGAITKAQIIEENVVVPQLPKIVETTDEITLKQNEMRDTIVLVLTQGGTGSGTIIDKINTKEKGVYEYRVLTNSHVTHTRLVQLLKGVDGITRKLDIQTVDKGCTVILFDYSKREQETIRAKVIAEDIVYDLAMLSFRSKKVFPIAKIASKSILAHVRVFDDVFAIGCQFGRAPTPAIGIISQIAKSKNGEKEWAIYRTTSQITPGSSGGGLFKKDGGHYYLIGIPYKIDIASNGQIIPHLAYAISIVTAQQFINENTVINP